MHERLLIFDLDSLVKLLTHYTEGTVPLSAEARTFEVSAILPRYISMQVESEEWDGVPDPITGELPPLHIRYEGKRVMKLNRNEEGAEWGAAGYVEAPRRQ